MKVDCPTCSKSVEWTDGNPYRPFCSDRCQLIDLGAWANEEYRLPAEDSTPGDPDQDDNSSNHRA